MFVFIILHYLAEDMTKECVKYIQNHLDMNRIRIIIVDNASSNGSGARLKQFYKDNKYCDVILNDENMGFARGNNVGYTYAKEKYDPDFMIIMNNDVLIDDKTFLDKIDTVYQENNFYILGPDIISKRNNKHQNPARKENVTKEQVVKEIESLEKALKNPFIYYIINKIKSTIRIRTRLKKVFGKTDNNMYLKKMYNPVLHGACYIFSRRYLELEKEAFDSRTFLYHEEEILHYNCIKKNYSMIYDPILRVNHLEDVSTDESLKINKKVKFKDNLNKSKFLNKHLLDSAKILLDVIDKGV